MSAGARLGDQDYLTRLIGTLSMRQDRAKTWRERRRMRRLIDDVVEISWAVRELAAYDELKNAGIRPLTGS